MSTINIVSDESVDSLEVTFSFGEGDLAHGCVVTRLLTRSGAGLMVGWSSCSNREYHRKARPRG